MTRIGAGINVVNAGVNADLAVMALNGLEAVKSCRPNKVFILMGEKKGGLWGRVGGH